MESNFTKRNNPSEFIIRIKNDGQLSIQGSMEHIHSGQVCHFEDFVNMILIAQQKMDEGLYPQSDTELRKFE